MLLKAVIPPHELRPSGGRPWIPARHILDGVLFVLRTGCQWKAVPTDFQRRELDLPWRRWPRQMLLTALVRFLD